MDNEKEISFGAFDSELMHQEIYIPEGFEATIDGDKIILKKIESEDERIRKELIGYIVKEVGLYPGEDRKEHKWLRWLEKQGEHKKFRDSIQVGDEVTRNSDGVIVNLSQLKRVAKKSEQKLPIEKLPEKMKTIGESLGFTTQEECDEYNEMVTNLIMGDDDKGEQKTALSEEELTDFEKSLKHVMEETLECGDIHNLKADADLLLRLVKPTDEDMKEALRTEYEKGRADAIAEMQKEWSKEDEEMFEYTINLLNYNLGCRKWLQSLKDRYTWKPSDKQIEALDFAADCIVPAEFCFKRKELKGLLEQLKKLKGH